MLGLLLGNYQKYLIIAGVLVALALAFFGWLYLHDQGIKTQATLEFNKAQLELTLKNQKEIATKLEEVSKMQTQVIEDLKKKNEAVEDTAKEIVRNVERKAGKKINDAAPREIQDAIEQLREKFK